MDKTQQIIEMLKTYNQEHIIKLLEKLEENKRKELIDQINSIDFHQIMELYENTKNPINIKENKIESIQYLDKAKLSKDVIEKFDTLGENIIRNRKSTTPCCVSPTMAS